jgi:hypothetical protein
MPGYPERIERDENGLMSEARQTDLAVMATVEAYVEQVCREAENGEAVASRLRAIEGEIQAIIDLATKTPLSGLGR